jgi:hypothetical protein
MYACDTTMNNGIRWKCMIVQDGNLIMLSNSLIIWLDALPSTIWMMTK